MQEVIKYPCLIVAYTQDLVYKYTIHIGKKSYHSFHGNNQKALQIIQITYTGKKRKVK